MNWRIRVLQTRALPLGYGTIQKQERIAFLFYFIGAGDEARTRYLHLGKVALYQMSYTRISLSDVLHYTLSAECNQVFYATDKNEKNT